MVIPTGDEVITHECEISWKDTRLVCKERCFICQVRNVIAEMAQCKFCSYTFAHKRCAPRPTTMVPDFVVIRPTAADLRSKMTKKDLPAPTMKRDHPSSDPVEILTRPSPNQIPNRIEAAAERRNSAKGSSSASSPLAAMTVVDRRRPINNAADPKPRANSSTAETLKHWTRQSSSFQKFNDGNKSNERCFDSKCPEILATHMAKRCAYGVVLDPFCGSGVNAIQLALNGSKVIAIDKDESMILLARRNARVYGVEDKIDFRVGDSFKIAPGIRADAIVTSPPWEGSGCAHKSRFDARDLCSRKAGGMAAILRLSRKISQRVVLHVPKNIDQDQSLRLARGAGFGYVEFEKVNIDGQLDAVNIYLKQRADATRELPAAVKTTIFLKNPPTANILKKTRQHLAKSDIRQLS